MKKLKDIYIIFIALIALFGWGMLWIWIVHLFKGGP